MTSRNNQSGPEEEEDEALPESPTLPHMPENDVEATVGSPRTQNTSRSHGVHSPTTTFQIASPTTSDAPTTESNPPENSFQGTPSSPSTSVNRGNRPSSTPPSATQQRTSVAVQGAQPPHAGTARSRSQHQHQHQHNHHGGVRRSTNTGAPNGLETPAIRPTVPVPLAPAPAMYWSRIQTHGKSPARALRAHTVNLVGEIMYVFGGCDARACFNAIYVFDADTMYWNLAKVNGDPPPPCRAHSSTLVDKRLYIFGGGDGPAYFNALYVFDTDTLTWSRPHTSGEIPSPRRAHTAAYWNDSIYIFGGGDGVRALNDTYRLRLSDPANLMWERIYPTGEPPISRGYHTANLVGAKLIVYGGSDGHECFSDLHILDLERNMWVQVPIETSNPRLSHTSTQVGSYLFILCGHDGTRYTSEVLLLNLVTMQWETRRVYGQPPSGRGYHTSVLYDSRLFLFGGYDGHAVFDDVYVLDLSACAYLPQITTFHMPEMRAADMH